jgi:hypothetical protein
MNGNRYELGLILDALRMCFRRPVLFWEGAGLLLGIFCFNLLAGLGMMVHEDVKAFVFPPLLLVGLFMLYLCVAVGNTAAVVLLKKEHSPLADWTDVLPLDKNVIRSIVMSALFFVVGAILLVVAIILALPATVLTAAWLAFMSLPVMLLAALSIAAMFQGLFMFPAFISTEIDERECLQRFSKFLQANWSRLLRFEGLFVGIAILLSLPQAAVAYLSLFFLDNVAASLGMLQAGSPAGSLSGGFPALVVATLTLAPLYALCALIPTSFLTAASYVFCAGTSSAEPPEGAPRKEEA